MQQQLYQALMDRSTLDWKNLLYELVEQESMNPWDVDVTLLTQKYIQAVKKMKETDLIISGKVVHAAALLLKMKSTHLIEHDINNLDRLLAQTEEDEYDDFLEDDELTPRRKLQNGQFTLIPRQPQPRSRKVSIHDLVTALQKAMESKRRHIQKTKPVQFKMPTRTVDIVQLIGDVYNRIAAAFKEKPKTVTFSQLLPSERKEDKVYTFIPMLHLEHEEKIKTEQKKHFGEIHIKMNKKRK